MFNNIGKKIKTLAVVVCWVGVVISVLIGSVVLIAATQAGERAGTLIAFAVMALGAFLSWIGSFLLYGFGQLVDNSDKLVKGEKDVLSVTPKGDAVGQFEKWRDMGLITQDEYEEKTKGN